MTHNQLHWLEAVTNIGSGLLLSIFIVQPVIFYMFNIHTSTADNMGMAILFTIVSIIRSYIWRRYFHNKFYS
jgi:hypothetical protein